ncbi:MAG TPA: response regulator [Adhaeribacter sp.]|nr:response regulator [Adhaeribacter sp.]
MKKILLIEDNAYIQENISLILEFAGYEIRVAENGLVGLKLVSEFQPDLIISDIMMPVMDGYEVLQALRANAATARIPFIFLTAKFANHSMLDGLEMGACDYLVKPFHEQELLIAIENCLNSKATSPV